MPVSVPLVRIFLSSPGDVTEERKIALDVIERLEYKPYFREKVTFRVVAWDKPGGGTTMRATLTPQEAIDRGLPKPSACDIVLVLFWSRLGTPFALGGQRYESGTHYELLDALGNPSSHTMIFKRTQDPDIAPSDPNRTARLAELDRVNAFMDGPLFYEPGTRRILRGINFYDAPPKFQELLELGLEESVVEILARLGDDPTSAPTPPPPAATTPLVSIEPKQWHGSPFPGLKAFTAEQALIFFGRERETHALLERMRRERFVAVVGASGSGKSSLVAAGVVPQLQAGVILGAAVNSSEWKIVQFTPAGAKGGPFHAMFAAFTTTFPHLKPSSFEIGRVRDNFVAALREDAAYVIEVCEDILADAHSGTEILFYIDQFEELFTAVNDADRAALVAMLVAISKHPQMRVVITMRSDFYHQCVDIPDLAELLTDASFPLGVPKRTALEQMIARPMEVAGLTADEGLIGRILDDTGTAPGALALMAYALDELYNIATARGDDHLSFADYDALGYTDKHGVAVVGVQGAIGKRAESVYADLDETTQHALFRAFHRLVQVDERGVATRLRTDRKHFSGPTADLVTAFEVARLLTSHENVVEVAHEALLRHWPRLTEWIELTQDDLRLLRQVRLAAAEWDQRGQPKSFLWPDERLQLVYAMLARLELSREHDLNAIERDFIRAEADRLLEELQDINTSHKRRFDIGDRLSVIGDPRPGVGVGPDGLPDIAWLPVVPGGQITIEDHTFDVQPFYIAKYLLTYAQFEAFVQAEDGFANLAWWAGMPSEYQRQDVAAPPSQQANYPRSSVSWYQAMACGRWLSARLVGMVLPEPSGKGTWQIGTDCEVRLPTVWEWQWAAQGGDAARDYPWGAWDEHPRANTTEAGINDRSTAVGMYPHGLAACEAADMAGNLWEWSLNTYGDITKVLIDDSGDRRVLRGGSFDHDRDDARCGNRSHDDPLFRNLDCGLRFVVACPPSSR